MHKIIVCLVAVGIETIPWRYYDVVEQANIHQLTSRRYLLCKVVVRAIAGIFICIIFTLTKH